MFEIRVSGTTIEGLKTNLETVLKRFEDPEADGQMTLPYPKSQATLAPEYAMKSDLEETAKPKRGRPKKTEAAEPVAATEAPKDETQEAATPTAQITLDEAKAILKELIATGESGVKKGLEILHSFGAAKISELKPEHYNDFAAKIRASLFQ